MYVHGKMPSHSLRTSPGNYFAIFFLSCGPLGTFCPLGTVILCLIFHVFILFKCQLEQELEISRRLLSQSESNRETLLHQVSLST